MASVMASAMALAMVLAPLHNLSGPSGHGCTPHRHKEYMTSAPNGSDTYRPGKQCKRSHYQPKPAPSCGTCPSRTVHTPVVPVDLDTFLHRKHCMPQTRSPRQAPMRSGTYQPHKRDMTTDQTLPGTYPRHTHCKLAFPQQTHFAIRHGTYPPRTSCTKVGYLDLDSDHSGSCYTDDPSTLPRPPFDIAPRHIQ